MEDISIKHRAHCSVKIEVSAVSGRKREADVRFIC